MRFVNVILVATCVFVCAQVAFAQADSENVAKAEDVCTQSKEMRDTLIQEAEREQFNVRYVEFVGNTYTRGRDLFKRSRSVNEGDIFTRKNLELALKRISKMGAIYPVSLDNVRVRLARNNKMIDITFCVKQKPKL